MAADRVKSEAGFVDGIRPAWHHHMSRPPTPDDRLTEIVRGEGIYVWDSEGNQYLDAGSMMGACMVGHGRREIIDAVTEQMSAIPFAALTLDCTNRPANELALRLLGLLGQRGGATWFTSSGSEAVEAAIRISLNYHLNRGEPRRRLLLTCRNAYHGTTLGATTATGDPANEHFWLNSARDFVRLPETPETPEGSDAFVASLREAIDSVGADNVAALIAEPIPTPGRVRVPPEDHWVRVQDVLHRHGILHVCDEVFDGFGRTGSMFAQHAYGIRADLTTVSKGLTSGYLPLGGVLVSAQVASAFDACGPKAVKLFGTYSGHPTPCAAATANLDIIEREKLPANAAERGEEIRARLIQMSHRHQFLDHPYGTGCIFTMRITERTEEIARALEEACKRRGLLIPVRGDSILIYPPTSITSAEVDEMCTAIDKGLAEVAERLAIGPASSV